LIAFVIKEKPTASFLLAMGYMCAEKLKKRLGQQFPHARRHERATTTTGAHLPAIFAVPHH
jgi:hypothetical protein